MPILPASASNVKPPKMVKVRQIFDDTHIDDVAGAVRTALDRDFVKAKVGPGAKVLLCVGSRGIANLQLIIRTTVETLSALGAQVDVTPAMGSHGGGTVQGMVDMLAGYGITKEGTGANIICTDAVTEVGRTPDGVPVYAATDALSYDVIVPVGRIKKHTSFSADIESGLCKMLTIGLGRHEGCIRLHREGFEHFPTLIPQAAQVVLDALPVGFGLAIVENAFDDTYLIEAVDAKDFMTREPELLLIAKGTMPYIMLPEVDVLILEQIGKDVSGTGMDPNITGRMPNSMIKEYRGPVIKRIVALSLTPGSHGNANGVGGADFITKALVDAIDFEATYANGLAGGGPAKVFIPVVFPTEEEAIVAAIWTAGKNNMDDVKVLRMKDTLHLGEMWISENLLPDVEAHPLMEVL